jgi:hypothetical protein
MKYSLRSLMIVVTLVCVVLGSAAAILLLSTHRARRGGPADMAAFLRIIKQPYSGSAIDSATDKCFVVGASASRYEAVLTKADRVGVPDWKTPYTGQRPTGTQYEFWCGGKDPRKEGDAFVVVVIDGKPPVITHAWSTVLIK